MKIKRMISVIAAIAVIVSIFAISASAVYGSKNYIEVDVTANSSGAKNSVLSSLEGTTYTYGVISVYNGTTRIARVEDTNHDASGRADAYRANPRTTVTGTKAVGSSSATARGTTYTGGSATAYF